MKKFFAPNLDRRGRIARLIWAALMFIAGTVLLWWNVWLALVLFAFGVFAIFEAARGWCVMRACGIKTKF